MFLVVCAMLFGRQQLLTYFLLVENKIVSVMSIVRRAQTRFTASLLNAHGAPRFIRRLSTCGCSELPAWPELDTEIDYRSRMVKIAPYGRHCLVMTPRRGAHDWHQNQNQEQATVTKSLMESQLAQSVQQDKSSNEHVKVLINQASQHLHLEDPVDVDSTSLLVFPDNIALSNVTKDKADEIFALLSKRGLVEFPLAFEPRKIETPTIFVCGHLSRDERCGKVAPVLKAHLEAFLSKKGIVCNVLYINHMGGMCHVPSQCCSLY